MNKSEILNEIKKTAEANGGVPLGKLRFFNETGVKETDWSGVYWVKWSDAINEAGFTPNERQGAYSEDYLLEKYARYTLELGHAPTSPELRLKAKNENGFPAQTTFQRLGSKKVLIGKLISYCNTNSEFRKVLSLIQGESFTSHEINQEVDVSENKNIGYVYLIQFGDEYKIGTSNNVERRFRELKTQMPYEGEILHTITTGDPEGIEAYWHNYYKEKRLKGEWFNLSQADIRYFKKRKLM
jgi:hypothetical protein